MVPVHFKGLNCYHDCIITLASHYDISYTYAFSALWSETDFRYDLPHSEYMPMRLICDLVPTGLLITDNYWCDQYEKETDFAALKTGEPFLIGMDAFYTPWNPSFMKFHGPHYYVAVSVYDGIVRCCDPTYNIAEAQIPFAELIEHAYTLTRALRVAPSDMNVDVLDEPRRILDEHPATRGELVQRINGLADEPQESIVKFAKYIDALINNRHLYRRFLEGQAGPSGSIRALMDADFFKRWNAVKFGVYKASVSGNRRAALDSAREMLCSLLDDEMRCAAEVLSNA